MHEVLQRFAKQAPVLAAALPDSQPLAMEVLLVFLLFSATRKVVACTGGALHMLFVSVL